MMNKELSPLQTVFILALFAILLIPILWAQGEATGVPRLSHMHQAPNGHLFILLGNRLFEHDAMGEPVQEIDLTPFGVETVIGDFAFFSNGDLLIRQGGDERDLLFNLLKFFRFKNPTPEADDANEGGLFRCHLENAECRSFGLPPLNLNDSFYLEIDWQDDRVFIADTSRHRILMLNSEGAVMDEEDNRLKFPNQIRYRDGELYVANTNYNEISVYQVSQDGLKRSAKWIDLHKKKLGLGSKVWPNAVLSMGEDIWVVSSGNNMNQGVALRFGPEGELIRKIEPPEGGDYFTLLPLDGSLLINDIEHGEIHRYSLEGERLTNLEPAPLMERLVALAEERESYRQKMYLFGALFVVALIIGFGIGFRQLTDDSPEELPPSPHERTITPQTIGIHWLEADPKIRRQFLMLAWFLGVLGVLQLIGFSALDAEMPKSLLLMLGFIVVGMVVAVRYMIGLTRQRIGIYEDLVILVNGRDKYAAASPQRISYSGNHIAVDDVMLILRTNISFFREEDLVNHLYPLLTEARNLTAGQMQLRQMRRKPVQTALMVLIMVVLFVLALNDIGGVI